MDRADVTIARGQKLLAQRQPANALAVFTALLERDAESIPARIGKAAALLAMGEAQFALATCDTVLATHPTRSRSAAAEGQRTRTNAPL